VMKDVLLQLLALWQALLALLHAWLLLLLLLLLPMGRAPFLQQLPVLLLLLGSAASLGKDPLPLPPPQLLLLLLLLVFLLGAYSSPHAPSAEDGGRGATQAAGHASVGATAGTAAAAVACDDALRGEEAGLAEMTPGVVAAVSRWWE